MIKKITLCFCLVLVAFAGDVSAQRFLTDMMDTTTPQGKGLYPIFNEHDRMRFGGYMQPQFQATGSNGVKSFEGGDFAPNSSNRFMLRRGRIRIDYSHFNSDRQPLAFFAFQFDGTERGVAIRDFWGRFFENKYQFFAVTAGMFARPMGFEVNLSSSDRESPERGRMSQTLMKTERDIGVMFTFDPRKKSFPIKWLKADLGIFNGQGLSGTTDYDNHKDLIGRISMKPWKINKAGWKLSASVSGYLGGITNQGQTWAQVQGSGANARFVIDTNANHFNQITPRRYYGADIQLRIPNHKGATEFRAETIRGQQTATFASSETPGVYPVSSPGTPQTLYTRNFAGGYIYFLQHLGTDRLQLVLKYDWYDPNTNVKGTDITAAKGFSAADVRYDTFGGGFVYMINAHVKSTIYYARVVNEKTQIAGLTDDVNDNVFTWRLQYRF
ncbi:MAG: porin [Chitinophagaceae bacterium]